ncbi:O-antigen ligase family protein [Marinomonas communis]|uniref:O-antigen ligase n=1 Tax=Marinomonas communis TaxID=28254 RepID=A0A4R6XC18_9GAMM|nr:O-antigen ligase family protein [Marinomonas communis]TDR13108.1 O-antigen ligase [Marinomonas communis]
MDRLLFPVVWFFSSITLAFSLVLHNGYSLGIFVLFLLSLVFYFPLKRLNPPFEFIKLDTMLFAVLLVYGLAMMFFVYLDGWHTRELDRPSRFIFALPVLALLMRCRPNNLSWLFYGVVSGAIGAFCLGLYERLILGYGRAHGAEHPIMFGDTSMMLGLMSCAAAFYFYSRKSYIWLAVSIVGVLCGVGGSVLSASRGGWVALPLIGLFLLWQSRDLLGKKNVVVVALAAFVIVSSAVAIPQTGIQGRVMQAVDDVVRYTQGDLKESSLGLRFDMWKGAFYLFQDAPLLGVGEYGGMVMKKEMAEQGLINPQSATHYHAHNEYLNALSLTGIIGFLALMAVYLVPLRLFLRKMREYKNNWNVKAYAMAGALVPMSYMDFALSQSMFSHNIGVMMYVFPIVFFWAAVRWAEKEYAEGLAPETLKANKSD